MFPLISLAALVTLALPPQAPGEAAKPMAVASIIGEEVATVAHVDLARWNVQASARSVLGKSADLDELAKPTKVLSAWVDSLKKAGAKDLFVLIDPTDMPGYPIVVVPIVDNADAKGISAVLLNLSLIHI